MSVWNKLEVEVDLYLQLWAGSWQRATVSPLYGLRFIPDYQHSRLLALSLAVYFIEDFCWIEGSCLILDKIFCGNYGATTQVIPFVNYTWKRRKNLTGWHDDVYLWYLKNVFEMQMMYPIRSELLFLEEIRCQFWQCFTVASINSVEFQGWSHCRIMGFTALLILVYLSDLGI